MTNSLMQLPSHVIRTYLRDYAGYYSDIEPWFDKVCIEAQSNLRRIWVVTVAGKLAGLAISKPGSSAKLCHFSITPNLRGLGIGSSLMQSAIADLLSSGAREVHVTCSDFTAEKHLDFFGHCGFSVDTYERGRYQNDVDEVVLSSTRESLRKSLFEQSISKELSRSAHFTRTEQMHTMAPSIFNPISRSGQEMSEVYLFAHSSSMSPLITSSFIGYGISRCQSSFCFHENNHSSQFASALSEVPIEPALPSLLIPCDGPSSFNHYVDDSFTLLDPGSGITDSATLQHEPSEVGRFAPIIARVSSKYGPNL